MVDKIYYFSLSFPEYSIITEIEAFDNLIISLDCFGSSTC